MGIYNIVLIGFMGTGKSSCGKLLAQRLHWEFVEMDKYIEQIAGLSIPDIFAMRGEPHFRDLETQACRALAKKYHAVISSGGGVVTRNENVQILRSFAYLILLTAPPAEIYRRIMQDGKEKRPLLAKANPMQEIERLLAIREPLYYNAADIRFDTSGKDPDTIVSEILQNLPKHVEIM